LLLDLIVEMVGLDLIVEMVGLLSNVYLILLLDLIVDEMIGRAMRAECSSN